MLKYDVRENPLKIIYAMLELHHGRCIHTITPEHAVYKFKAEKTYRSTLEKDKSPQAKAILTLAKLEKNSHQINVNEVAQARGLLRKDLVKKISDLNCQDHIELRAERIMIHRYRVMKPLPTTKIEIYGVADNILKDLEARENSALKSVHQVIDLMTGEKCFHLGLAEHFGITLPGEAGKCESHCTYCLTGRPVQKSGDMFRKAVITHESIKEVLDATDVRDDPRFLARVGFGTLSPRVTALKLKNHAVFGKLQYHDFDVSHGYNLPTY